MNPSSGPSAAPDDDQRPNPIRATSLDTSIRITNENWRGKKDPNERRRIQNRLNQRAFRQRQRAGESTQHYKSRSGSATPPDTSMPDPVDLDLPRPHPSAIEAQQCSSSDCRRLSYNVRHCGRFDQQYTSQSAPPSTAASSGADTPSEPVWDELAELINKNLMDAAGNNARHLAISLSDLCQGNHMITPSLFSTSAPSSLAPLELQYTVPHDPIIDILPHQRLRFNILTALARGALDQGKLCNEIRQSGGLVDTNGVWQRGGLVTWSFPEEVEGWELSELFVRRWAALLTGCEDLIAATNTWRQRRGEHAFPLMLDRSVMVMLG